MFHNRTRRAALLTLALAVATLPPQIAPAQTPAGPQTIAAVSIASYQNVLDDVNYVGGLIDRPQSGQMVEGMIAMFTQGQGLVGLDRDRPWGVLVQSSGQDFSPVVCLPVTDLDGLLAMGEPMGMVVEDMGEDVKSVSMQGQTIFVKPSGDWVFAAQRADQLASLPADPVAMLGGLNEQYDIGVRLMAQNVPEMYKQLAIGQLKSGMQDGLVRNPEETDAQFETRQKLAENQVESIEQLINDLDEAVIGISVNPDGGGLVMDFRGSAVAGTKLADQLAMYQASGTRFGGFLKEDASVSVASAYAIPANVLPRVIKEYESQMATARAAFEQMFEEAELPNEAVRATLESALDDLLGCADAMIRSGKVDTAGFVQLNVGDASAVFAISTPNPDKVDSALKKVAALAEGDPNFPTFKWADQTFEGVTLHTLSIPVNNPDAEGLLGPKMSVAIGIGTDAAYFAIGPDSVAALKQAITASGSGDVDVKPMQTTVDLEQVMDFAAAAAESSGQDAAVPQMMAQLLKESDSSSIHLTAEGEPNGLRYRITVEEGVLQAVGKTGAEMQRAQMQP